MPNPWKPQSSEVYIAWANAVADEAMDKRNPTSRNFISDLIERFELNPNFKPTQKQAEWLEDLYARYIR